MIKLIGTTHLTPKEEIIRIIESEKPDVIGVELCKFRLNLLVINPKLNQIAQEQLQEEGIMAKISNAIKKKAEEQKIEYGSDQITASKYALDNNIPLVLLDRDATEINNLMNKIPQNEQIGFMQELQKFQEISLTETIKEANETETLNTLKTKYPVAYEFLIASREQVIINNILKAIIKYPNKKILTFLGKGHVKSIGESLDGN